MDLIYKQKVFIFIIITEINKTYVEYFKWILTLTKIFEYDE